MREGCYFLFVWTMHLSALQVVCVSTGNDEGVKQAFSQEITALCVSIYVRSFKMKSIFIYAE